MYLIIKHKNQPSKELRFRNGPIYIGRQLGSQVFLPDRTISRQHAVIYSTTDGQWILEDLDSANKTYLNGKAIHKEPLTDGDMFTISDFNIEVKFRETVSQPTKINMEDTMLDTNQELRSIKRKITDTNGPAFKLSPERVKKYAEFTCKLASAKDIDELLEILITQFKKQLLPFHIWAGFKLPNENSFNIYKGRSAAGQTLLLEDISLRGMVFDAMNDKEFILIPRFNIHEKNTEKIRSAMIAPILHEDGCMGAIYLDNSLNHEQYDIMDLNYLMLLSINFGNLLLKLGGF